MSKKCIVGTFVFFATLLALVSLTLLAWISATNNPEIVKSLPISPIDGFVIIMILTVIMLIGWLAISNEKKKEGRNEGIRIGMEISQTKK